MRGVLNRLRTRRSARRSLADDPRLAPIAEAFTHRLSSGERSWTRRIERERKRLEASDVLLRTPEREYSLDPAHEHVFEERLGELCLGSSKPPDAARFLFALLRQLRPVRALELGTALGISAAYQGAALHLNGGGARLVTVEASAARMDVAREVLTRLELDEVVDTRLGRFQEVIPEVLREPVGFAFVDGHHDEHATLGYASLIQPALVPPGVIVFDDIAWSEGMKRAWAALRADAAVIASAEVLGMGVCTYRK